MKRDHLRTLAVFGLMLSALIGMSFYRTKPQQDTDQNHRFSSYAGNHDGYLAWFELLEADGFEVEHYGHRRGELDEQVQSLVVASDTIDAEEWFKPQTIDAEHAHAWIEAGGTAILVANSFNNLPAEITKKQPTQSLDALSKTKNLRFAVYSAGIPIGRGHVLMLTSPSHFSNAEIGNGNNAEMAIEVVHGSRSGRIAFEEASHGYGVPDNLLALLPSSVEWGLALALASFLVWLFGVSWRVGPARRSNSALIPSSREFITALAGLIERGAAWPELFAQIQQTLRECEVYYPSARSPEQATLEKLLIMKPSRSPKDFILAVKTLQNLQPRAPLI